jgi:hypothetical protein
MQILKSTRTRAIAGAVALVTVLVVLTAVFAGRYGQADTVRRTPTPLPPTNTPTITETPTVTLTPTDTPTPTQTPTPFPTKDVALLGNTVMVGGSTGTEFLATGDLTVIPLFGGGVDFSPFAGGVLVPGALTHLTVRLYDGQFVTDDNPYVFIVLIEDQPFPIGCVIPSKGKGNFCEDGDKDFGCVEIGPQDTVAVVAFPAGAIGGQVAGTNGGSPVQASWVAKLDIGGTCSGQILPCGTLHDTIDLLNEAGAAAVGC